MRANALPASRPDALDAERFEEMIASPPFRMFRTRVHQELERARTDCENQAEPAEIHRAQGKAKALRTVLDLPVIVLAEIEARKNAQ